MSTAHTWHPITDLPANNALLEQRELRALETLWNEQRDELYENHALVDFNERLQREWAIETGIIEQIYTLDRGVTRLLIERGIDASLISHEDTDRPPETVASIIQDQKEAIEWVFEVVKGERGLTEGFLKELHQLLTRNQHMATGIDQFGRKTEIRLLKGTYKVQPNNPSRPDGSVHEYCPWEHVDAQMAQLMSWHGEHMQRGIPPEIEAAWFHHRFTQIHPFQDGNGRVIRAATTLILLQHRWFPLVVTRDDKESYISALETADYGDLSPFIQFVAKLQKRRFIRALSVAQTVLTDQQRVDQMILAIKETLEHEARHQREEWEMARSVANSCIEVATERLGTVANELKAQLTTVLPRANFFVSSDGLVPDRATWNRFQIIEAARDLEYFANVRVHARWTKLAFEAPDRTELLIAMHGLGTEWRGVVAVTAIFYRREPVDNGTTEAVDIQSVADEVFQINYVEDPAHVVARFADWLEMVLIRGLEVWRRGL